MSDFNVNYEKVMEDMRNQNLQSVVDHVNESRDMVNELKNEVAGFKLLVAQQNREMENLRSQIVFLLQKNFGSGPTG